MWIILAILDFIFTIVCYLTNPIVALFADERGCLPRVLRWWQTYDNPLDVEWMLSEGHVPKWAMYDFHRHYSYIPEWDAEKITGVRRGYVIVKDGKFTQKEMLQRYICRLCWMYRNTGHGFSYKISGVTVSAADIAVYKSIKTLDTEIYIANARWGKWCIYYEAPWCKKFRWRIYLGWKYKWMSSGEKRCMLACFVWPFRKN